MIVIVINPEYDDGVEQRILNYVIQNNLVSGPHLVTFIIGFCAQSKKIETSDIRSNEVSSISLSVISFLFMLVNY